MASDLLYSHSFSRYSHLKPFQALIINFKGLHNAVLPSIWCYCIEIRPKAATFGILIYPRIRNGFSVQIKIKREPAISFYFIKEIFIWIWTENVGGAISVLIPIKRESINDISQKTITYEWSAYTKDSKNKKEHPENK